MTWKLTGPLSRPSITSNQALLRSQTRSELAADVEAYIAKGKEIEQLPGFAERPVTHRVGHGRSWGITG